jgi:zinc transport system permease protein
VTRGDLAVIWGGAALVAGLIYWRWQRMVTATHSADLAQSEGIRARREDLILTLALAVTVALALKVVGALLIAALLLIPAAAARSLARSPEAMALGATLMAMLAVLAGLALSLKADTPAGPSIVAAAAALFALSLVFRRR